jgi:hypothetical protein
VSHTAAAAMAPLYAWGVIAAKVLDVKSYVGRPRTKEEMLEHLLLGARSTDARSRSYRHRSTNGRCATITTTTGASARSSRIASIRARVRGR